METLLSGKAPHHNDTIWAHAIYHEGADCTWMSKGFCAERVLPQLCQICIYPHANTIGQWRCTACGLVYCESINLWSKKFSVSHELDHARIHDRLDIQVQA
jgi:hypothetical protein